MTYTIYQIADERDSRLLLYMHYEWAEKHGGVNLSEYDAVYTGEVEGTDPVAILESLYTKFNIAPPADYTGRRMSVSDVVQLERYGTYFCDSIGFKKIK